MKTKYWLSLILFLPVMFIFCGKTKEPGSETVNKPMAKEQSIGENARVTFLELGSVTCIPCRQMQPIMKSIETKYGGQVKVVFFDVWKDKKPAQQYGIKLIPTQIFLDENGKEFFRHEGFFPEEEIDKLLASKGLTITK